MNLGSTKQVERQKSHLGDRIINIEMTKSIYFIIAQKDIIAENSGVKIKIVALFVSGFSNCFVVSF